MAFLSIRMDTKARNSLKIHAAKKKLEESLNKQYRQKVLAMFKDALTVFPQFSGDTVSNFRLVRGAGGELAPYKRWAGKTGDRDSGFMANQQAKEAGNPDAINFAFTRAKFVQYDYRDKVYIVNSTPLEFTGTTVTDTLGGVEQLRPVNLIAGGQRLSSYLKSKYGGR